MSISLQTLHQAQTSKLSKSTFSALGATGSLDSNALWMSTDTTSGHDADYRLIDNSVTGGFFYLADGNRSGVSDQVAIIGTNTHPSLIASDFAVIA
jgi:Ca2+-binding RTX toxin-like protein